MNPIKIVSQLSENKHSGTVNAFDASYRATRSRRDSDQEECIVWGMLALVLRVSRVFGLAPLGFTRAHEGWRIRVSHVAALYSFLLMFTLHTLIITGGLLDLCNKPERSVRARTLTARVLYVTETIIMLAINGLGVYRAQARMKEMILQMNIIEKTKLKLSKAGIDISAERKGSYLIAGYLIGVIVLGVAEITMFINEAVNKGKDLTVSYLYLPLNLEIFIVIVFAIQFSAIALRVGTAFCAIIQSLIDLTQIMDLQQHLAQCMISIPLPSTALSAVVDTMTISEKISKTAQYSARGACGTIRRLVFSYGTTCDMMRQVNSTYGPMLLLFVGSILIHLVQSPYYLFLYLFRDENPTVKIVVQVFFFLLYVSYMMIVIEPGQRIYDKIELTKALVGQLLRRGISRHDPLVFELNLFIRQITLNKVGYSPFGVCVLTRPLMATIFGGVTTYLVIILQFQAM